MKLTDTLKKGAADLPPSVFALVMATGIISIGSHLLHFDTISHALFVLNCMQYPVLLLLLLFRLLLFFPEVSGELSAHDKGAGFLTIVAASCIMGMQFVLLHQSFVPAVYSWIFAVLAWLVVMYTFFISLIIKKEKPSLEKGMNGSWLLVVVATQSLSILACTLQSHLPFTAGMAAFFSLAAFLLGFILYVIIITLVLYRLIFFPLSAEEFTPSYWIDTGACAITTLAAATFITANKSNTLFTDLIPFLKTSGVLCWAVSTWWIPLICMLEVWRHVTKKVPLKYNSSYWSMVFPLGMYTVCTLKMADALQFTFLTSVSTVFIYISLAAWLVTFAGMCFSIVRSLFFAGDAPGKV